MPVVPHHPRREPAINLPGLVLGAIGMLVAIQAVREWLAPTTDLELLLEGAFIPARWSLAFGFADADRIVQAVREASGAPELSATREALARYVTEGPPLPLWSLVTYALLHGSWTHVGLNCVWLAAFATPVVRRAGTARSLVLALATCLGGALAQWIADPLAVEPVIGASAIVSGFMAAAATFVFSGTDGRPWLGQPARGAGGWGFLANRNVLVFVAVWLTGNLLFGVLASPIGLADGRVAWQAHIGGFLIGLLFPLIDPLRTELRRSRGAA